MKTPDPVGVVPRRLVTIQEAAKEVHVTRRTIYTWIAQGKLETRTTAGGQTRIYADTLWQQRPRQAPTSTPRDDAGDLPPGALYLPPKDRR